MAQGPGHIEWSHIGVVVPPKEIWARIHPSWEPCDRCAPRRNANMKEHAPDDTGNGTGHSKRLTSPDSNDSHLKRSTCFRTCKKSGWGLWGSASPFYLTTRIKPYFQKLCTCTSIDLALVDQKIVFTKIEKPRYLDIHPFANPSTPNPNSMRSDFHFIANPEAHRCSA